MSGYVLGVDGGGTKSHLAIFKTDGTLIAARKWGALNHECMGESFTQMEAELAAFVDGALKSAGLKVGKIENAVLGLAGCDTAEQHEIISAMVQRIGLPRFKLINDAFIGLPAIAPVNYGICAINGTGATLAAVDKSGVSAQIGGVGELSDDSGGGGWYAAKTIGAVYNALFRDGKKTSLTERLFAAVGADNADDLMKALTYGDRHAAAVSRLAFGAAEEGDEASLSILRQSADSYGGSITHIARVMDFPAGEPLYVTMAGSVFAKEKSEILPNMIKEYTDRSMPNREVVYTKLTAPPVSGAVIWALNEVGAEIDKERVRALCAAAFQ